MRILLIEDRQTSINVLKKNLEKHCFAVDFAEDGEKGLFMATTNPYDLIILDYGLPKKEWLSCLQRNQGRRQDYADTDVDS